MYVIRRLKTVNRLDELYIMPLFDKLKCVAVTDWDVMAVINLMQSSIQSHVIMYPENDISSQSWDAAAPGHILGRIAPSPYIAALSYD